MSDMCLLRAYALSRHGKGCSGLPDLSTDRHFMRMAEIARGESHDPNRRVGAILVGKNGAVLATGANRPPLALRLTREDSHRAIAADPNWKYFMLEHAERNAINNARNVSGSVAGATMYSTLFPCADCARAIVGAGIERFVAPRLVEGLPDDEKWHAHFLYAHKIFELAGVQVDLVTEDPVVQTEDASKT